MRHEEAEMNPYRYSLCLAAAAGMAATPALALPCAGFTDVDSTSAFCGSVEWVKNRSITTGCTSATAYCPNDAVTRLQMAAFMARLGGAMTQANIRATTGLANAPGVYNCQTQDFAVTGYPRRAIVNAAYSAVFDGAANYRILIYASIDGGATWIIPSGFAVEPRVGVPGADIWSHVTHTLQYDLAVGFSYRFAVRYDLLVPGPTMTEGRCTVNVAFNNRISTSSPFDPAADADNDAGE
jgi:hypothetical protein